ncbi:zinc finger protein 469-like isoform X2 [Melanerpes formicivorus]|uniref:zinc finger protein 469-like isoform X2 n=1 Tax=Melanerpes formicivorus TaxID=211600 RepID=UPI00358F75A4
MKFPTRTRAAEQPPQSPAALPPRPGDRRCPHPGRRAGSCSTALPGHPPTPSRLLQLVCRAQMRETAKVGRGWLQGRAAQPRSETGAAAAPSLGSPSRGGSACCPLTTPRRDPTADPHGGRREHCRLSAPGSPCLSLERSGTSSDRRWPKKRDPKGTNGWERRPAHNPAVIAFVTSLKMKPDV